jgi:hypothetical protein
METKKQTAVHWLLIAMTNKLSSDIVPHFLDLFDQALAMEKEQIKEAYYKPLSNEYWHKGEQWLNEESEIYYTSTYE